MTGRLWGCGTALITPFTRDGSVDERALTALVDWQIAEGIHFLVPCGSTGEAATLTPDEHSHVVRLVSDRVAGRVPVVAGAGSNDTNRAIQMSKAMRDAGATHLLHVSPMYNKPPQRGIIEHFRAIAGATDLPVIVYNVPGRTGSNVEARTTLALSEIPNIAGIKEASGNLVQIQDILRERPPHFSVLSGDDALTLGVMAAGGDGVISVTSNAAPKLMALLVEHCRAGAIEQARTVQERLLPWMSAAFLESNPIPAKAALASMGKIENVLRLPLVPLDPRHDAALREALWICGAL
ncbi:MAG: 4-hydroxy-tetrahydrodipicolinate synthase [Gemmatimonadaceae bacterium]